MANIITRGAGAVSAAVAAFVDAWQHPDTAKQTPKFEDLISQVGYRWSWYVGTTFWPGSPYLKDLIKSFLLYDETRMVWNPVPEIVDFWAGIVYPGELTDDAESAIPLDEKTKPPLRKAIAQIWEWGNWATNKSVVERYVAGIGYDLIIAHDDVEDGEVYPEIIWPSHVKSITLSKRDNVQGYTLEYPITELDEAGNAQVFIYREVVDKRMYRTYRGTTSADMRPYDISPNKDRGAEWPNPYGFVPAVWRRFRSTGGAFSPSCLGSAYGELAGINSLESHVDDQVHKSIDPTTVFWSGGGLQRMLTRKKKEEDASRSKAAATLSSITTDEVAESARKRQAMRFFEGPVGGRTDQVSGTGDLAESRQYLLDKKEAFKDKFPEYTLYKQLRQMSQVTGPAAEMLLGDSKQKVVEIRGDADRQTKKLAQMCVAIAGWRLSQRKGGWARRTPAQQKFAPFGLGSYDAGDLDFNIGKREFIPDPPMTQRQRIDYMIAASEGMGIDKKWLLENVEHKSASEIAKMLPEPEPGEEVPPGGERPGRQPGQPGAAGRVGRTKDPLGLPGNTGATIAQIMTPGGE